MVGAGLWAERGGGRRVRASSIMTKEDEIAGSPGRAKVEAPMRQDDLARTVGGQTCAQKRVRNSYNDESR